MKKIFHKSIAALLSVVMAGSILTTTASAEPTSKDVIILYTNDVHCGIDSYDELAAYRAQLIQDGHTVVTVDAGDAIQGEAIGVLTKGSAIVDLMNTVGYNYSVPGNHEFDYSTDNLLNLAYNEAQFEYLCSNFIDLQTDSTVFKPYEIAELNGEKVAFIGISTPETYTKSTPTYFQDDNGNYIYGFSQDNFYTVIQDAVDSAINEGAQRVIAIGHLGIDGTTDGWKSIDVIANTTGIDVLLDAHSHEVIFGDTYKNKNGEAVTLSSTGTKLEYFGKLTLSADGAEKTELIKANSINIDNLTNEAKQAYDIVHKKIDNYNAETEYLNEVVGTSEIELTLYDPDTEEWVIRKAETNMANYITDAYRSRTGADISIMNSGGIRASVDAGEVTRKELMDVNPWNNDICVINATGQQIIDALEHGARLYPDTNAGFLQVSGLTYDIHSYIESPVILNDDGSFAGIDNSKQRRISNVKIGGTPVDTEKNYTVAGTYYLLKQGGDGYTMFADSEVVKYEGLGTDAEMLISYLKEDLNGKITAEQYGNLRGDGRIKIYTTQTDVPSDETPDTPNEENTTTPSENTNQSEINTQPTDKNDSTADSLDNYAPTTGNSDNIFTLFSILVISLAFIGIINARRKEND